MRFPFFFLSFLIASQPICIFTNISPSGQLVCILSIISIIYLSKKDNLMIATIKNKYCKIWIALIVYHLFNAIFKGIVYDRSVSLVSNYSLFFASIFNCYFTMIYTIYCLKKNSQKALYYGLWGYLLFLLFAFSLAEFDDTSQGERLSGAIYSTQFAQAAGMALLFLVFYHYNQRLRISTTLYYSILPILAIILCGSRNGFGLLLLAVFAFFMGKLFLNKLSSSKIISLILFSVLIYYGINQILENTVLGERILQSKDYNDELNAETGTILDYLGDRSIYYLVGWSNLLENPISGIGLFNYVNYNHSEFPLHSEYLTHLTEGGIVGAFIYLLFIGGLFKRIIKMFLANKNSDNILILILFMSYLSLGVTAREFYYIQFYPILGLCIYYSCEHYENRDRNLLAY